MFSFAVEIAPRSVKTTKPSTARNSWWFLGFDFFQVVRICFVPIWTVEQLQWHPRTVEMPYLNTGASSSDLRYPTGPDRKRSAKA
jgi:hypothetical protein